MSRITNHQFNEPYFEVFLRIIHTRVYPKLDQNITESQLGFRNDFSTRAALYSFNVLIKRAQDVNTVVYACFIDFDRRNHGKLMKISQQSRMDDKDVLIIGKLYWDQDACVLVANKRSDNSQSYKESIRTVCCHR